MQQNLNNTNKIQTLLDNAVTNKTFSTAILGDYTLDNTVSIPENVTLILDRCNLTVTNNGKFVAKNVNSVKIIGVNNSSINFLDSELDNCFIHFENVSDFQISGLNFNNFNSNFMLKACKKGKITDIIYK